MNIDMLLKGLVFSVVINEYWYAVERFSIQCGNKWILICCWKVSVFSVIINEYWYAVERCCWKV